MRITFEQLVDTCCDCADKLKKVAIKCEYCPVQRLKKRFRVPRSVIESMKKASKKETR